MKVEDRRRLAIVAGDMESVWGAVAVRDQGLDGALARVLGDVRTKLGEDLRDWLDPENAKP